jgi:hypothetical protein
MTVTQFYKHPNAVDRDNIIRKDLTDLTAIVDTIDEAGGRNDHLRAYIYTLRDLQHAIDTSSYEENDAAIRARRAAVNGAFDRLIVAEFILNRLWLWRDAP